MIALIEGLERYSDITPTTRGNSVCLNVVAYSGSGRFSIGENLMEWILWAVLAVMLALLCYTLFSTSIVIRKKV